MGRAEDLFLRIKHAGTAEIDRMIADEVVEELFLDYKRAATVDPFKKLDLSDRKNLAKAIAGFANSEGGVIVWGVDCRQNPPRGDVPTKSVPITNPNAFKSLLEGSLTGLTLPAHPGVENISFQIKGRSDGFVVTHIPARLNVPYRTLVDGEDYYIRAGSNFVPTPHAVLAGLFGRAPHPQLEATVKYTGPKNRAWPCQLGFAIYARNNGRGLADDIFFSAEWVLPEGCQPSFPTTEQWEAWTTGNRRTFVSKSFPRLPPGSENMIAGLVLNFGRDVSSDAVIDLTCGSRNGSGVARRITLPAAVLHPALLHYVQRYDTEAARAAADKIYEESITASLANNP
jgi:Putative DNA-binding domain